MGKYWWRLKSETRLFWISFKNTAWHQMIYLGTCSFIFPICLFENWMHCKKFATLGDIMNVACTVTCVWWSVVFIHCFGVGVFLMQIPVVPFFVMHKHVPVGVSFSPFLSWRPDKDVYLSLHKQDLESFFQSSQHRWLIQCFLMKEINKENTACAWLMVEQFDFESLAFLRSFDWECSLYNTI